MAEVMTYICPSCGNEVKVGGSCPSCPPAQTSRKRRKVTHDKAPHSDPFLEDEPFDYDEFIAREFGKTPHRKLRVAWYWWWLGVLLLLVLVFRWL